MSRNKPLIVPETYQGGKGLSDCIARFETMATINGRDGEAKLNWIKACLAGRTQKAFQVYQRHHKVITREQRQH